MANNGSDPNTASPKSGSAPQASPSELLQRARRYDAPFLQSDPVEGWKSVVRDKLRASGDTRNDRIALRITAGFIILGLLAGASQGISASVSTLGVAASALLVQELPRALMARRVGLAARIELSLAGTRTELTGTRPQGSFSLAFAAVGSLSNLIVAGSLWLAIGPWQGVALCHGAWGVAQILPLNPFRGGEVLASRLGPQARFAQALISVLVTTSGTLLSNETRGALFLLILLAVTAALIALVRAYTESDDALSGIRSRVDEARALLVRGEDESASNVALRALEQARSSSVRTALRHALVWAALARGDCITAHRELMKVDPSTIDLLLLCAYLASCRRDEEALALLDEARARGQRSVETTRLHLDLLLRNGRRTATVHLAAADEALLSETDRTALEHALGKDEVPFLRRRHQDPQS